MNGSLLLFGASALILSSLFATLNLRYGGAIVFIVAILLALVGTARLLLGTL